MSDSAAALLWDMKQRAMRAHKLCNELRLAHPEIPELGDDGVLHEAIHDILRVHTPNAAPQQDVDADAPCGACGSVSVDTGFECNDCGFDNSPTQPSTSQAELLPKRIGTQFELTAHCPFCGCEADLRSAPNDYATHGGETGQPHVDSFFIHCDGCGCDGPVGESEPVARDLWNDRADQPAKSELQGGDEWRCFHCDDVFTDRASARKHFGPDEQCSPACTIDVTKFRCFEAENRRYHDEDALIHRQMRGMENEHQQALRRAEEDGYAKGLAAHPAEPAQADVVTLPIDWRREGMVVAVDSATGQLLGCMGKNTWAALDATQPAQAAQVPEGMVLVSEGFVKATTNYVRCANSGTRLSPYIKENGLHGGSPWSEFVDEHTAMIAAAPTPAKEGA